MEIKAEEKVISFLTMFYGIVKFKKLCINTQSSFQELAEELYNNFVKEIRKILGDKSTQKFRELLSELYDTNSKNELISTIKDAYHLSTGKEIELDIFYKELDTSFKRLTSLFSNLYLNNPNNEDRCKRYYSHKPLSYKDYKILLPEKSEGREDDFYGADVWRKFENELKNVLNFYKDDEYYYSLINLLLLLFEKYMWCLPNFTLEKYTDTSLYNHIKDVMGIATAICKSGKEKQNLNLIIGDLPGIQKYIFNVSYKNPAKILRGRSIFVQILTRHFATLILKKLNLTEANLVMLAGGKFYIIAQESNEFLTSYKEAINEIESYLIENFNYQLGFSSTYETFDYTLLKSKELTFGEIIDRVSYKLLLKRNQQFKSKLFYKENFDENNFILSASYMETKEQDTNKIKDAVTGLPIRKGREKLIQNSNEGEMIDKQVWNEIEIGSKAPQSNIIISFNDNFSGVDKISTVDEYDRNHNSKILLNPDLEELLSKENLEKDILKNTQILEVANYTTTERKQIMDFDSIEKTSTGAEFLTLIKGDVDNLGLIMSSGLVGDKDIDDENRQEKSLTGISRTTTLSNHLKYFFSFSLNGFLNDWENGKISKDIEDNSIDDQKVYTVFAGGDDLMLVCPQSSSLKLLGAFNKTFNNFVCKNPEAHISYSLTNFKHGTPFRIVAEMAEDNQSEVKKEFKGKKISDKIDTEPKIFYSENDKAGTRLFETDVKNDKLLNILTKSNMLKEWVFDEKNKVTKGVLRNLLTFTKIMNDFYKKRDSRFLMWHPKLTYMINRLLKNKEGKYYNPGVKDFFEQALSINKGTQEAIELQKILFPVISEAIYRTRNYKGE